jgi:hypothetical protein
MPCCLFRFTSSRGYAFDPNVLHPPYLAPSHWGVWPFTHLGYAFWVTGFLGLYVLIRYFGSTDRKSFPLSHTLVLYFGGLVFGAFASVPMWFERGMTILYAGFDISRVPDPTWKHLLYWSNYRFRLFPLDSAASHWYGGYMGATLVVLAGVGFVAPFVRRQMSGIVSGKAAAICLVAALILVFGYRWSVFQSLVFVRAANSGRYLILVSFFLSLLACIGAANLINKWGRNRIRMFTTIFLLIVLDLGPTTFQQPYLSADNAKNLFKLLPDELVVRTRAPSGRIPDFRVFYTNHNIYRLQIVSWLPSAAGLTTFTEMFFEAPQSVKAFSQPLETTLNTLFGELESGEDLTSKENFSPAMLGLYLSNTKHIISYRPETGTVLY